MPGTQRRGSSRARLCSQCALGSNSSSATDKLCHLDRSLTSEPVSPSVKWVTLLGTARPRTAHTPPCSPRGPVCVPSKVAPL